MAFFQVNFFSPSLCFNTDICVFVPTPNSDEILNHKKSDYFKDGAKFQTLYLLHGAYGDYTDWFRLTGIERYAQEHKLAVVMPSASNSFYQNMYKGSAYLTYLLEEISEFVTKLFPLSKKRENTFVAGLSMGGYGALRLAFQKPEQFAACATLSGAVDIAAVKRDTDKGTIDGPFCWNAIFENTEPEGTQADIFELIKRDKEAGLPLPKVFQSCGTEDFIYPINVEGKKAFEKAGIDLTYEEHPGIHDWDYWDTHIRRVLDWLPLNNDSVEEG